MRVPTRPLPLFVVLVAALAFILVLNAARIQRVHAVTAAEEQSVTIDRNSPTGYAGGIRQLIVADHNAASYQWIVQAQQGTRRGIWRVRHVDYDNAPFGRLVLTPSPYRWWLALLAHVHHFVTGRPLPISAEAAAAYADPLLHALLLVISALVVARAFGVFPATLVTIALASLFPFGGWLLGGAPDDHGLGLWMAWLGLLALLVAMCRRAPTPPTEPAKREPATGSVSFLVAGLVAGVALWINPAIELAVIFGVAVGAVLLHVLGPPPRLAGAVANGKTTGEFEVQPLWIPWALGGAAMTLIAYLVEYAPDYLGGWNLRYVHPLYGVAWLGLGAILAWIDTIRTGRRRRDWRTTLWLMLSVAAIVVAAVVAQRGGAIKSMAAALALAPSHLPNAVGADTLWSWVRRTGVAASVATVILPLVLMGYAGRLAWRQRRRSGVAAVALMTGPALVLLGFGCVSLHWLGAWDVTLAALLTACAAAVPGDSARMRWTHGAAVVVLLAPGAWLLGRAAGVGRSPEFSEADVVALVERDVAHWLANRVGATGAIVLAPPSLTTSLYYHGGLKGLGTPYWENDEGMNAAVRLAAASSPDEGLALARRRAVNYIVLPSWDNALDELVRTSSNQPEKSLLGLLHQWHPPRWLRAVPYPMPAIPGFEGRSVAVFEVVDVQDNATALSRLAEYFVEAQRLQEAAGVAIALEHTFPNDLGAMIARSAVAFAYEDPDRIKATMQVLTSPQSLAGADALPWDRQVSYAIALAQGQHMDLAAKRVQHCLAEIDEAKLRFLTPQSLYRFQLLCRVFHLQIEDTTLRALARDLLPPELRDKV